MKSFIMANSDPWHHPRDCIVYSCVYSPLPNNLVASGGEVGVEGRRQPPVQGMETAPLCGWTFLTFHLSWSLGRQATSCLLDWNNVPGHEGIFISKDFRLWEAEGGEVRSATKGRESRPSFQTTFTFLIELAHMIPIIFPSSLRAAGHGVG